MGYLFRWAIARDRSFLYTLKQRDLRPNDLTECGHGLPMLAQAGSGGWASHTQTSSWRTEGAGPVAPRANRVSWELEAK